MFYRILQSLSSCDYPRSRRLISGDYLIICSNAIYFYDSNLQNIITEKNISSCISDCPYYTVSSQFLEEDNEYVIASQKDEIYIFSKNGIFLSSISISYYCSNYYYSIVTYGHSGDEYYFAIMNINSKNIIFKKYIFN